MNAKVRLRIFSTREDPSWDLAPEAEARFLRWAEEKMRPTAGLPAPTRPVRPPVTGYRGFDVTANGRQYRVYQDGLLPTCPGTCDRDARTFDEELFETNEAELRQTFGLDVAVVRSGDAPQRIAGIATASCPIVAPPPDSPQYRPAFWRGGAVEALNTCYNYATNVRTHSTLVPGVPNGNRVWTELELRVALRQDKVRYLGKRVPTSPLPDGAHLIVGLIGPHGDYHFLRLDRTGKWSQKVSSDPPTNVDNLRRRLSDLCSAQFEPQYKLAGFFATTPQARAILLARGGGQA
jgi:hypothetical protein